MVSIGLIPIMFSKKFYILKDQRRGFFAMFRTALENLQYCEKMGYILIPDWTATSYNEKEYGDNAWDYYFEPLGGYKLEDIKKNDCEAIRASWDSLQIEIRPIRVHSRTLTIRQTYNHYINRYIRIKPSVPKKVNTFYEKNMKWPNILGIHMRRTDHYIDHHLIPYGRYPISDEKFIENIDKYVNKYPHCKIFIATDSQESFDNIKASYGDRVISWDSIRSKDKTSIHGGGYDNGMGSVSNYKKGEDALIDCLLLSRCDFLIRNTSDLSVAALHFNPNLKQLNLNRLYQDCMLESWIENTVL
jgi:hypothetical protein